MKESGGEESPTRGRGGGVALERDEEGFPCPSSTGWVWKKRMLN
jgi:hypothetical protein